MCRLFDEERNTPFYGSEQDLAQLVELVENCLVVLREAVRPREMVLETWITVDFAIRRFLLSGFELTRFLDAGLDVSDTLLPRSFPRRLDLLKAAVAFSSQLPLEAEPRKPDREGGFSSSLEFWRFVQETAPDLIERIREVQRQYVLAKNPGMSPEDIASVDQGWHFFINEPEKARMSVGWRRVAANLDKRWFDHAERLNRARNRAAHSFRPEDVSGALGLTGPDVLAQTRQACFEILSTLLGVKSDALLEPSLAGPLSRT